MNCTSKCCRGKIPLGETEPVDPPRYSLTLYAFGVVGLFLFLTWIGSF